MAITLNSIDTLKSYLNGVMGRADHHAGNVEGVALALLGAVMWKSTGEIEVKQYDGRPANMLWFFVGSNRYAMRYDHSNEQIELRDRTRDGDVLARFDNNTSYQEIITVFERL